MGELSLVSLWVWGRVWVVVPLLVWSCLTFVLKCSSDGEIFDEADAGIVDAGSVRTREVTVVSGRTPGLTVLSGRTSEMTSWSGRTRGMIVWSGRTKGVIVWSCPTRGMNVCRNSLMIVCKTDLMSG